VEEPSEPSPEPPSVVELPEVPSPEEEPSPDEDPSPEESPFEELPDPLPSPESPLLV
jgi:hypothetical protein